MKIFVRAFEFRLPFANITSMLEMLLNYTLPEPSKRNRLLIGLSWRAGRPAAGAESGGQINTLDPHVAPKSAS